MQQLLIDTEMLYLLLTEPEKICQRCHDEIEQATARRDLCISVVSLLQLREAGRTGLVKLSQLAGIDNWINSHEAQIFPIDVPVLVTMGTASEPERIADRLILATAQLKKCTLVTKQHIPDAAVELLVCNHLAD